MDATLGQEIDALRQLKTKQLKLRYRELFGEDSPSWNQHARLMELDPKYVDVIVERWQSFSGHVATLDGDGRSFADIKTERSRRAA